KLITYPRTDSRYLPSDYAETVGNVVSHLETDAEYMKVAAKIAAEGPQNLDRLLDDTKVSDHFAIVPTGNESDRALSGDDAKIYELVVRQFMAALMGPATWATVERLVALPFEDDEVLFRTTARSLEIPGFLEALGSEVG